MAKRYEISFESQAGMNYRLEIHDTAYSGAVTQIDGRKEGFSLNWSGGKNIFSPIFGSQCTFRMQIQNTDDDTFVSQLVAANEERFRVVVYKGTVGLAVDWMGFIITDQVTISDEYYPYTLRISAIDGISRLKDKDFLDGNGDRYIGRESALNILLKAIQKIGLEDTDATFPTIRLRTNFNWYEDQMDISSPLDQIDINHEVFYGDTINEVQRHQSAYDVIEKLCKGFNARFWFSKGKYHFHQIAGYQNDTQKVYNYDINGTLLSTDSAEDYDVSIDYTNVFKRRGTLFTFAAPNAKSIVKYNHLTSNNRIKGFVWNQGSNTSKTVIEEISVPDFDTTQLKCVFRINVKTIETFQSGVDYPWHRQKFYIRIKIGSLYLTSNTVGNFYEFETEDLEFQAPVGEVEVNAPAVGPNDFNQDTTFEVAFTTPFISPGLDGESVEVRIFRHDIIGSDNASLTPTELSLFEDFFWESQDNFVEILNEGDSLGPNAIIQEWTANVDSTQNTSIVENEIHFGDGPTVISTSKITIDGEDSANWGIGSGSGVLSFGELNAQDLLGVSKTALRKHQGTLIAKDLDFENRLIGGVFSYIPLRMTMLAKSDQITGEWIEVDYDSSGITVDTPVFIDIEPVKPGGTGGGGSGSGSTPVGQNFNGFSTNNIGSIISVTQSSSNIFATTINTTNQLPIDPVDIAFAKEGDLINLINPVTGSSETLTVASNYVPGATTIDVVEDLNDNYPTGSYINLSVSSVLQTVTGFIQKEASFSGEYWDITAGDLPDPATVSEGTIDQRVKIWRSGIRSLYNLDQGFEIDVTGVNNRIKFKPKCRGENLFIEVK